MQCLQSYPWNVIIQTCTRIRLNSCYRTILHGSNGDRRTNHWVNGIHPKTCQKCLIWGIFICVLVILQKRMWDIRATKDIVLSDGKDERLNHRTKVIQHGNTNNEKKKEWPTSTLLLSIWWLQMMRKVWWSILLQSPNSHFPPFLQSYFPWQDQGSPYYSYCFSVSMERFGVKWTLVLN